MARSLTMPGEDFEGRWRCEFLWIESNHPRQRPVLARNDFENQVEIFGEGDLTPTLPTAGSESLRLPVAVLLDNVRSMYNVGAFFRAADGVGLEKVCLCGITAHPPKNGIAKTALGAEQVVAWEHNWNPVEVDRRFRSKGYEIAAIETSPHAVDLYDW